MSCYPRQHVQYLANTFLAFSAGHPFLNLVLERHLQIFDPVKREFEFGPALLTSMIVEYDKMRLENAKEKSTRFMEQLFFPKVTVFDRERFFPLRDMEYKMLFDTKGAFLKPREGF